LNPWPEPELEKKKAYESDIACPAPEEENQGD